MTPCKLCKLHKPCNACRTRATLKLAGTKAAAAIRSEKAMQPVVLGWVAEKKGTEA
jgi:hypothetical protein